MRKGIIILISILVVVLTAFEESREVEHICQELLNKRAAAWNRIFDGDYCFEDFSKDMESLARDSLLLEDIEAFKYFRDNSMDMEKVLSIELCNTKVMKKGSICHIEGIILWHLESQEGKESISDHYCIEMKKHKGNWYLVSLEQKEAM